MELATMAWCSEAVKLEAGQLSDAQGKLAEYRHSAVWTEFLIRECECSGESEVCFCPVTCLCLKYATTGQRLFPSMTGSAARKRLVRYLTMLEVPSAATATLKTFRSSRATNLALAGRTLPQVLAAGEWKSAAVLSYTDA
eukprot:TRINITY_DN66291_c0_g1_i1.p1 TRINITY_DN66291_c0_g1~~TRINITY_DN66291_c0_g1_i1.p1  ORF type:complete len:140 (-),score=25.08 TRINITY_DN66291_c0_g1_i1:13-432(-)